MRLISVISKLFDDMSVIKDKQFYDKDGSVYVSVYYDYFEVLDTDSYPDGNTIDDSYFSSSLLADLKRERRVLSDAEIAYWERIHGLDKYKGGLQEFIVKDGIKCIGSYSFAYNLNLKSVVLPQSLEKIGDYAFTFCRALKEITIPQNVTKIGERAFDSEVEKMYFQCAKPPKIADLGISSYCRIYVPKASCDLYLQNKSWKKYKKQIYGYE